MPKTLTGKVISTKMDKTAVVEVERAFRHPLYQKTIRKHKKYKVHVEPDIKVSEGDTVEIQETRPISKEKHFTITKIIEA